MNKVETISDCYKAKNDLAIKNQQNIGYFNVFKLYPNIVNGARHTPFRRRDYFKITLVEKVQKFHFTDNVNKYSLVFSNPHIPYSWEQKDQVFNGYFCIFNQAFFRQFRHLNQYSAFQPTGNHIFELSREQYENVSDIFIRMSDELNSDYVYKYDLLRTMVYEMVHFALKIRPTLISVKQPINAAKRISELFLELLESQFPVDEHQSGLQFRTASDFADKLNVHVNHLNRIIKEATQKTTTQVITERILQESKFLLKQNEWSVSKIAFVLGFSEVTHFNNFFKKNTGTTPLKFRKG
ncbi:helix-turn-helix domain-containing protein [Chondrinema litorale]|uniref:helix-turn-helix domain-containing protein n=1 Tax=Chondrinema litorale TaxID=2994555 RepID=UPI002543D5B8|nr:helix-turn-helix transcriptional regulator [Chondrinema litorale]UZR98986.1 helix-turn-helix transcriptional regulator [Chondrinema litorale]